MIIIITEPRAPKMQRKTGSTPMDVGVFETSCLDMGEGVPKRAEQDLPRSREFGVEPFEACKEAYHRVIPWLFTVEE